MYKTINDLKELVKTDEFGSKNIIISLPIPKKIMIFNFSEYEEKESECVILEKYKDELGDTSEYKVLTYYIGFDDLVGKGILYHHQFIKDKIKENNKWNIQKRMC